MLSTRTISGVKSIARPYYARYLSWQADREHLPVRSTHSPPADAPDHVLVCVVDALRPDFVPDLPMEFTQAVAPSTWTFPSVTSIHTGLYPHEHGAVAHTLPGDTEYAIPSQASGFRTLPEVFEAHGYDTLGATAFVMPFLALRGWYRSHRIFPQADAGTVLDYYRGWRRGRERTFAYVHLGDLHEPMTPPASYVEARDVDTSLPNLGLMSEYTDDYDGSPECVYFRQQRLALYRAALDHVEDALRAVLAEVGDDTLVVVTGDHGESHWEHYELDRQFTDPRPNYCVGHGATPYDMMARVPLAIQSPTGERLTPEGGWASLVDLAPTLVAGLTGEGIGSGVDWRQPIPENRAVFCEGIRYGPERKAVYRGETKLIRSVADDVTLTAHVDRAVPGDEFVEFSPALVAELLATLPDAWGEGSEGQRVGRLVGDQLEALGYV